MIFKAVCFVMILTTNSFVSQNHCSMKNVSRLLKLIQRYFELMYQFVLVFNPFIPSSDKRLSILKQICSF